MSENINIEGTEVPVVYLEDLKLIPWNDPRLARPPSLFDFENPQNDPLLFHKHMHRTMVDLGGVGLSANQVGMDMRFFTMGIQSPKTGEIFTRTCFNPELLGVSEEEELADEGCLSLPGLVLKVKRPKECDLRYTNEHGEEKTEHFMGIAARVVLHEYDHMLGVNFMTRVSKLKLERAFKKLNKKSRQIKRDIENGVLRQGS
tara:strand:+ start:745 stop:1350 length:606 start_codon:yes stop_codon:yes gene_type:complete